jgi:hypothetical protein
MRTLIKTWVCLAKTLSGIKTSSDMARDRAYREVISTNSGVPDSRTNGREFRRRKPQALYRRSSRPTTFVLKNVLAQRLRLRGRSDDAAHRA